MNKHIGSSFEEEREEVRILNRVLLRATEVFGNPEVAESWMTTPIAALGWKTPSVALRSLGGEREVRVLLGRLEHGLF